MLYISKLRDDMETMSFEEGMKYCIDTLEEFGLFYAQRSWMQHEEDHNKIKIFRYEDFAADNYAFLIELLKYLCIDVPQDDLRKLYGDNTFSRITGGRELGDEDERPAVRLPRYSAQTDGFSSRPVPEHICQMPGVWDRYGD